MIAIQSDPWHPRVYQKAGQEYVSMIQEGVVADTRQGVRGRHRLGEAGKAAARCRSQIDLFLTKAWF